MSTAINGTITTGGTAQLVSVLNATTSISISNPSLDPIIFAWNGNPASPTNGILISGTTVIDNVSNNPGLWVPFSAGALSVHGPRTGQSYSIVYT